MTSGVFVLLLMLGTTFCEDSSSSSESASSEEVNPFTIAALSASHMDFSYSTVALLFEKEGKFYNQALSIGSVPCCTSALKSGLEQADDVVLVYLKKIQEQNDELMAELKECWEDGREDCDGEAFSKLTQFIHADGLRLVDFVARFEQLCFNYIQCNNQ